MENIYYIAIILSIISLVIAFISIYYTLKVKKKYERIAMKLGNGQNITDIFGKYIAEVNELNKKDDSIIEYCNKLSEEETKSIKRIGIVKYNLYNTTKNDLSFSLALLNNKNSGIVISSIYGIDNSNVYCKVINNGKSKNKLSAEEIEAIKIAMEK